MSTILIILVILLIVGGLPNWGYSRGWNAGYYPSLGGFVLLLIIVWLLFGH